MLRGFGVRLELSPAVEADLRAHAREAYPQECCGLLIGILPDDFGAPQQRLAAEESLRLDNTWETETRGRRYQIDSSVFARLERELAERGRGVLGVYHSHPNHAAWPSPFDLDHAWPSYAYLIVSVRDGVDRDARVWLLSADRNSFVEGSVVQENAPCP
ncbi:MAG: hypothetical protein COR54_07805 [Elusimicrobia bacterium CG22_combo_CG10-13_8_21_14_all_63_91]|nr:MAG: hypothetical protein COR54_07805 [Elusimicrobia bacterium CG22_combo_CG10-13_8_21_14_all_63_91]PJA17159.1 MAG: hypothetical protein COX66_05730 [Elusimicrobia bacterium CG_4_10_14_0_2_um_filter_63_34]